MNGMANINPAGRSHYASAIPVPRAMAHGKLHAVAPPSTLETPVPHGALSPRSGKALAPSPKTLKPKDAARATGHELAKGREGSPSISLRGGQKAPARPLVSPGKWPEAVGSGRRGAGRVGEPTELPKAPTVQSRGGGRPGGSPGKGSGVAMEGMEDEPHGSSQGRGPVFGSGAITFSSGPPHSHPITATVAPFQYRLQEDWEEKRATALGDECPGPAEEPDPDPKAGGLSELGGAAGDEGVLLGGCRDGARGQRLMPELRLMWPRARTGAGDGGRWGGWGNPMREVP
ncbi:uncharacterized protein ENSP00000471857-like isoform X1 [Athene cunicularia]|uniref:uncharacterized protein ENSP00000471857-like isoform X1 n=1 Tax=Athene cunicularia TaxID=194338 RepID=UPI000EF6E1A1|nr:uncharacterized protein ENSP00000471857-like isoform X1 [Athene cunicularia]